MRVILQIRARLAAIAGVLVFIPVAQAVIYLALDPKSEQHATAGIAAVWITTLFTAIWLVDEVLRDESVQKSTWIYIIAGKADRLFFEWLAVGAILTAVVAATAWITAGLLFHVDLVDDAGALAVVTASFSIGLSALIVTVRQIAAGAQLGGFLGVLLLFPLATPIIVSCVQLSRNIVIEHASPGDGRWLLLTLFFGILYALMGLWTVPQLIRE